MDLHIVTFWVVCSSCLIGLAITLKRIRSGVRGWVILYLAILLLSVAGWLWGWAWLVYVGAVLWLTLVVLPGLMALRYQRRVMQQRYSEARSLARVISWLHPADGWREQPEIMHALDFAQSGEVSGALEIFKRHQSAESPTALTARTHFYRLTGQWHEFLAWNAQHREPFDRHPHFLHALLRARGETGDLQGLIALYQKHEAQIAKLDPPVQRDLCRLMLFAFLGRRDLVERLLRGPLGILPKPTQDFWVATAQLAAGERETARLQFEAMLPTADATMRLAIERPGTAAALEMPDGAAALAECLEPVP